MGYTRQMHYLFVKCMVFHYFYFDDLILQIYDKDRYEKLSCYAAGHIINDFSVAFMCLNQ